VSYGPDGDAEVFCILVFYADSVNYVFATRGEEMELPGVVMADRISGHDLEGRGIPVVVTVPLIKNKSRQKWEL
jgi:hypothetical protein